MKTLILYHNESYQKYPEIYVSYTFEIDQKGLLKIFKISKLSGEAKLIACYNNWDYFRIEENLEWDLEI